MSPRPSFSLARGGQWPPRRRQALLIVPAFALIGLIWAGEIWALTALQAARCPADSFFSVSPPLAAVVITLATAFPAIGFGFVAANALVYSIPSARRFLDPGQGAGASYRTTQSGLPTISAWIAGIGLPLAFVASLNQACLSSQAIAYRPAPWVTMRYYPWRDVSAITTACTHASKGGWTGRYVLTLRDGAKLDVMGGFANVWKARPQLSAALHGRPFTFDSTRVDPRCRLADVGMLLQKP